MIISHDNRRRSDLLQRLFGNAAFRGLKLVAISAAAAAGHFGLRGLHRRHIHNWGDQGDVLLRLLHNFLADVVRSNQYQAENNDVGNSRESGTTLLVVIEAPNIFDRHGLRSKHKRWLLFGEEGVLEVLDKRLPQGLLGAFRHEQIQFGFRRRALRWFEFQGCHYVTRVVS